MEDQERFSLCPACDDCPEVVVAADEVVIGEPGNQVRLSTEEWNVLVEAVQTGKLRRLGAANSEVRQCDCGCGCC